MDKGVSDDVLDELASLRAELRAVRAELDQIRAGEVAVRSAGTREGVERSVLAAGTDPESTVTTTTTSRRGLLALAGGAAVAAATAGAVLSAAQPAAAAGVPVTVGDRVQSAAAPLSSTQIDYGAASSSPGTNLFNVHDFGSNLDFNEGQPAAVAGYAANLVTIGVAGHSTRGANGASIGVMGVSSVNAGTGVSGTAFTDGIGVSGNCGNNGLGVSGLTVGTAAYGVFGFASKPDSFGVGGTSSAGTGVAAVSTTGVALNVGGNGRMVLASNLTAGAPTTGARVAGEVVRDGNGDLYICYAAGTPGSWRKLGGGTTAGSLHVINPTRVYDSRLGVGGAAITGGNNRVISVANGIDITTGAVNAPNIVPAGATAVTYNLTITQATVGGFLAVTPGDAPAFAASSINWTAATTDLANASLVKLNATREVKVFAGGGGTTQFIIDVTGYYL